jgi:hypothetical protein
MRLPRALFVGSLALLMVVVTSCGPGKEYNPRNVTVTISPAMKTIPANGQVALLASVNNFCPGCTPQLIWSISENSGTNCTWEDVNTPPTGPCPGGTIQGQGTQDTLSPSVIYFAPTTGGTFEVDAVQFVTVGENITGTSLITVSP